MDYSKQFQNLIDLIGGPALLNDFAYFQGRSNCDVFVPSSSARSTRNVQVPSGFTGVAYDGAHWKGYENGVMKYDSYITGIQRPGTNNFCQSYATYLWSKRGNISPFISRDYARNSQLMCNEWLKYFEDSMKQPAMLAWLKKETKGYDLELAIHTLNVIQTDIQVATDFANSKEDSI
jgi:hypothetical protein